MRALRAWQLWIVRGLSQRDIATVLGISLRQVIRDLATMRIRSGAELSRDADALSRMQRYAAEVNEQLQAVNRQAWTDLMQAAPGSPARVGFLNVIATVAKDRIKVLQSLGMVPTEPDEVLVHDISFDGLSDSEVASLRRVVRQLLAKSGGAAGHARPGAGGSPALDRDEPANQDEAAGGAAADPE